MTAKLNEWESLNMKYQNENPVDRLHPEEPFFFIRAQDKLSVDAVLAYAELIPEEMTCAQYAQVLTVAQKMKEWQEANPDKVKLPDYETF